MSKLSKAEAGYIEANNSEFVCGDCVFAKNAGGGAFNCGLMETAGPISMESGSCNNLIYGVRGSELPYIADKTLVELGYMENEFGFGCKRCRHWDMKKRDCDEVDKNSPGDTPGEIAVTTCCNLWAFDPKRGKMSTPKLFQLIELTEADPRKQHPDDYRKMTEMGG